MDVFSKATYEVLLGKSISDEMFSLARYKADEYIDKRRKQGYIVTRKMRNKIILSFLEKRV